MRGRIHPLAIVSLETSMRDEYDLSPEDLRKGIRGRFVSRFMDGVNLVPINPDGEETRPGPETATQGSVDDERASRS